MIEIVKMILRRTKAGTQKERLEGRFVYDCLRTMTETTTTI